jgi:hypothetical protein
MSAVSVMVALLQAHSPLLAFVEPENIVAGTVAQGARLPAIGVREISAIEEQTVDGNEPGALVRARVQVTVHAKSYPAQKALIAATKLGSGAHSGVIAGVTVRSVLRDLVGPDLSDDDAEIYEQSRDFKIVFIEPD